MQTTMIFGNEDIFIAFFSIWLPSIYFSCCIMLVRNSSMMLNNSGVRGHCYLISYFRRKNIYFFIIKYGIRCFCVCMCVCVISSFKVNKFTYIPSFLIFLILWLGVRFYQFYICVNNMIIYVSYLIFLVMLSVNMVYHINQFPPIYWGIIDK